MLNYFCFDCSYYITCWWDPKKFKSKEVDGWSNLYDGKNFTIGYVNEYRVVRLNKHRIIDSFEKLEDELSQLNEGWNNIFNSRATWRTMSIKNLKQSVKIAKKYYETEASGNVTLKTVKAIASTGVNRISVGSITHSAPAIDFKLEI